MFHFRLIAACLAGLAAACAHAETTAWQGRIGSAPIVLELGDESHNSNSDGRYFYRKRNADIALAWSRDKDGKLHLTGSFVDEQMELTPKGAGWEGQWRSADGKKTLPVTLEPLDAGALAAVKAQGAQWKTAPYDLAKRAGMSLKAGKKEKFMGYTLEWMQEAGTKIKMFRVRDGFAPETLERVNAVLEERQWQEIYAYFSCQMTAAAGIGFNYSQKVTPRLLNARLLSLSLFTDADCGGAYPNAGDNPLNLNIETAEVLDLDDFLWIGPGQPPSPRTNPDGTLKNRDYRVGVLAPWLAKTMTRLHSRQMTARTEDAAGEECDYASTEPWSGDTAYLTPQGIYIGPEFNHASQICAYPKWSVLPWRIVNEHPGRLKGPLP